MPLPKIFRLSLVPRVIAHYCFNLRLPVPGAYVTMSCLNNFLVAVSGAKIHSSPMILRLSLVPRIVAHL
jgi:hypothetical protein